MKLAIKSLDRVAILISLCWLLTATPRTQAQTPPKIQWQLTLGGTLFDAGYSMKQTPEGDYLVVGYSNSIDGTFVGHHGSSSARDAIVAKIDSNGSVLWAKSLGGSGSDIAVTSAFANDGGYLIGATSYSNDGDVTGHHGPLTTSDGWLVKLDPNGTLLWQKSIGGSGDEGIARIVATEDHGYLIAANTNSNDGDVKSGHQGSLSTSDYWVIKIDSAGKILWEKTYGGTAGDSPFGLARTKDNAYILSGNSNSNDGDVSGNHGGTDIWVLKINDTGKVLWQRSLGGPGNEDQNTVAVAPDGSYFVGGSTYYSGGDITTPHYGHHDAFDIWIVKLAQDGNILWERSLGGSGRDYEQDVHAMPDGGCLFAGYSTSNDINVSGHHGDTSQYDAWIGKLDSNGALQWQKSLGGSAMDGASSIINTLDGGYLFAGNTQSTDGDITSNHGSADCWIVKFLPQALENISKESEQTPIPRFSIYPNPSVSTSIVHISASNIFANATLEITDVLGCVVLHRQLAEGSANINLDISHLQPGMYVATLRDIASGKRFFGALQIIR